MGGEWSASRPCRFTPEERPPGTHRIEGCVGTRAGLDEVEKRKFLSLPGLELRPLGHPACSQSLYQLRYTIPSKSNPHDMHVLDYHSASTENSDLAYHHLFCVPNIIYFLISLCKSKGSYNTEHILWSIKTREIQRFHQSLSPDAQTTDFNNHKFYHICCSCWLYSFILLPQ
jgi:hypothetical protein